jgi:hypothetical protein
MNNDWAGYTHAQLIEYYPHQPTLFEVQAFDSKVYRQITVTMSGRKKITSLLAWSAEHGHQSINSPLLVSRIELRFLVCRILFSVPVIRLLTPTSFGQQKIMRSSSSFPSFPGGEYSPLINLALPGSCDPPTCEREVSVFDGYGEKFLLDVGGESMTVSTTRLPDGPLEWWLGECLTDGAVSRSVGDCTHGLGEDLWSPGGLDWVRLLLWRGSLFLPARPEGRCTFSGLPLPPLLLAPVLGR